MAKKTQVQPALNGSHVAQAARLTEKGLAQANASAKPAKPAKPATQEPAPKPDPAKRAAKAASALQIVAKDYGRAVGLCGKGLWHFAQSLLVFTKSYPQVKQTEIGEALAKAAGRVTPYSATFVSRALKAARNITTEPKTAAEGVHFADLFYGNAKKNANRTVTTPDDKIKVGISWLKSAIKDGADKKYVLDAVIKGLNDIDADESGDDSADDLAEPSDEPSEEFEEALA